MRNLTEVLRNKEEELDRVRKEVEALRLVAPLLGEDADRPTSAEPAPKIPVQRAEASKVESPKTEPMRNRWP
jgi:hypothetical protein